MLQESGQKLHYRNRKVIIIETLGYRAAVRDHVTYAYINYQAF